MDEKPYLLTIAGIVAIVAIVAIVVMLLPHTLNYQASSVASVDTSGGIIASGTGPAPSGVSDASNIAGAAYAKPILQYMRVYGVCASASNNTNSTYWTYSYTAHDCRDTQTLNVYAQGVCANNGGTVYSLNYNVPCSGNTPI